MARDESIEQPDGQETPDEQAAEDAPAQDGAGSGEPASEGESVQEPVDGNDETTTPAESVEGEIVEAPAAAGDASASEGGNDGADGGGDDDEDEFDVEAFFAAGANSPGAVTASDGPEANQDGADDAGSASVDPPAPPPGAAPPDLPDLSPGVNASKIPPDKLDLLSDVDLQVTIELGRTRMLVEDVLRLAKGSVVELEKLAGDPVDVFVNGRLVAKGEVLVLNDTFCVRVNELVSEEAESEMRRSA